MPTVATSVNLILVDVNMDLNLIAIAVFLLLAILLTISIFNDWKRKNFSVREVYSSKKSICSFLKIFRSKGKR